MSHSVHVGSKAVVAMIVVVKAVAAMTPVDVRMMGAVLTDAVARILVVVMILAVEIVVLAKIAARLR